MNSRILEPSPPGRTIGWADFVLIACIATGASLVAFTRAMSHFDIFDYSGFMDVFYRIANGQKLYSDFFYNAGPVHPYIGAFFFAVFGPGKLAIMANSVLLNTFMTALSFLLAREQFGRIASAALAALATLYFSIIMAFPTYDHHAWMFALAALALLRVRFSKAPQLDASLRGACCGMLVCLSLLAKSNIGISAGAVVAGVLFLLAEPGRSLLWLGLGLAVTLNVIFLALGTPFEFINNNFTQYAPLGRLTNWSGFVNTLHTAPFVPFALMTAALASLGGKEYAVGNRRDFSILLGLAFMSLFSIYTGSMIPDLNAFALGFEFVLLFTLVNRLPRGEANSAEDRTYSTSLLVAAVFAAITFVTGIEKGWRIQYWYGSLHIPGIDYQIKAPQLRGWNCIRDYCEPMDEAVDYLNSHISKDDYLLVFLDLTIIYQLTGHESYRQAPYEFALNTLPTPGKAAAQFMNYFDEHRPKWIMLHDVGYGSGRAPVHTELQLKSLQFDVFFKKNYAEVWRSKNFSILKLR